MVVEIEKKHVCAKTMLSVWKNESFQDLRMNWNMYFISLRRLLSQMRKVFTWTKENCSFDMLEEL